jgi:hypothetical protein
MTPAGSSGPMAASPTPAPGATAPSVGLDDAASLGMRACTGDRGAALQMGIEATEYIIQNPGAACRRRLGRAFIVAPLS